MGWFSRTPQLKDALPEEKTMMKSLQRHLNATHKLFDKFKRTQRKAGVQDDLPAEEDLALVDPTMKEEFSYLATKAEELQKEVGALVKEIEKLNNEELDVILDMGVACDKDLNAAVNESVARSRAWVGEIEGNIQEQARKRVAKTKARVEQAKNRRAKRKRARGY